MTAGMAAGVVSRFVIMRWGGRGVVVGRLRVVIGMGAVVMHLLRGGMFIAAGRQRRIGRYALEGQGQHQQPGSKESNAFHEVEF